jgi:hypothetical protein
MSTVPSFVYRRNGIRRLWRRMINGRPVTVRFLLRRVLQPADGSRHLALDSDLSLTVMIPLHLSLDDQQDSELIVLKRELHGPFSIKFPVSDKCNC